MVQKSALSVPHLMRVKMNFSQLKSEFRLTSDGDDWGNTMIWWFSIADEIYFKRKTLCVPPSWKFKPSPAGFVNDLDDYVANCVSEADDQSLMRMGNLVHRYARFLKHLGKDY